MRDPSTCGSNDVVQQSMFVGPVSIVQVAVMRPAASRPHVTAYTGHQARQRPFACKDGKMGRVGVQAEDFRRVIQRKREKDSALGFGSRTDGDGKQQMSTGRKHFAIMQTKA